MSDTATNQLTPEQQARADRINSKIAELTALEGKWFANNDGRGLPVKVVKYAGIFKDGDGGLVYTLTVESTGHARWNPPASDFLKNFHEVTAPAVAKTTTQEPI